jgi:hypothetical protein
MSNRERNEFWLNFFSLEGLLHSGMSATILQLVVISEDIRPL